MTWSVSARRVPVELTADPSFERRIRRLAVVSAVALGFIWGLAVRTLEAPVAVNAAFAAGWLLMPSILVASLPYPRLRYALVLPATLVSVGLLAVAIGWLPTAGAAAAGWLLMLGGVMLGATLGLWLWYRLLPVPPALDPPFARGRWLLIGIHVVPVVAGLGMAASALR